VPGSDRPSGHVNSISLELLCRAGNVSLGGLGGRDVLRIGWKDADCKIVLVAYSV